MLPYTNSFSLGHLTTEHLCYFSYKMKIQVHYPLSGTEISRVLKLNFFPDFRKVIMLHIPYNYPVTPAGSKDTPHKNSYFALKGMQVLVTNWVRIISYGSKIR